VTITGANFTGDVKLDTTYYGTVSFNNVQKIDSNTIRAQLVLVPSPPDQEAVYVTSPYGSSYPVVFGVTVPTLTGISPTSAMQGSTVTVTFSGTNFGFQLNDAIMGGTGVSGKSTAFVNSTTLRATFTIEPSAPPGPRDLKIVTPGGATESLPFTITGVP
jgi:hypothetical protein